MSHNPNAAGLAINWHVFSSNGQEKADYSRGVLERFTRRAPNDFSANKHVKMVTNPRMINRLDSPHYPTYFEGYYFVNEHGKFVQGPFNEPPTTDKIVVNHYHTKSREEYRIKRGRGIANKVSGPNYSDKQFESHDRNEEFDDGILRYRFERAKNFRPPDKSHADERLLNALMINLSPTLIPTTLPKFYAGKMETFLTCRAVAAYLKPRLADDTLAKFFEEAALNAILRSFGGATFADARLFLRELPTLLSLPYPAAKEVRRAALSIIPQLMHVCRVNRMWHYYVEFNYLKDILNIGG